MGRARRLIAAGVAALIVGLLLNFPARVAYYWFAPEGLALSGITGSVWNGHATEGSAAAFYFRDLAWRFRPMSLFRLQAGFVVMAELPGGFINTNVAVTRGNQVRFSDLVAAAPLATINALLPGSEIDGSLNLQFGQLVLDDGLPAAAEGTVTVSGLVVRALSPAALGDYRTVLQTNEEGIEGTFEDLDGVLDVDGTLLLTRDRSYSFVGRIAATAEAPASVHEQLRFLGSADTRGQREFRFEGSL